VSALLGKCGCCGECPVPPVVACVDVIWSVNVWSTLQSPFVDSGENPNHKQGGWRRVTVTNQFAVDANLATLTFRTATATYRYSVRHFDLLDHEKFSTSCDGTVWERHRDDDGVWVEDTIHGSLFDGSGNYIDDSSACLVNGDVELWEVELDTVGGGIPGWRTPGGGYPWAAADQGWDVVNVSGTVQRVDYYGSHPTTGEPRFVGSSTFEYSEWYSIADLAAEAESIADLFTVDLTIDPQDITIGTDSGNAAASTFGLYGDAECCYLLITATLPSLTYTGHPGGIDCLGRTGLAVGDIVPRYGDDPLNYEYATPRAFLNAWLNGVGDGGAIAGWQTPTIDVNTFMYPAAAYRSAFGGYTGDLNVSVRRCFFSECDIQSTVLYPETYEQEGSGLDLNEGYVWCGFTEGLGPGDTELTADPPSCLDAGPIAIAEEGGWVEPAAGMGLVLVKCLGTPPCADPC
jgi:hypothetical protein